MLQRIFRFDNTIMKERMTPRLDITGVNRDDDVNKAIMTCIRSGHQRLPIYEDNLDNTISVVTLSDLVRHCRCEEGNSNGRDHDIEEVHQLPESKNVDNLFEEMRRETVEMALSRTNLEPQRGL